MRKSTKLVKKLLALFLVVLMSIDTLAAVVSDNDGSAFITKAEFDSLKNNFQAQIDTYNVSIDNKIDTAIANYLQGIKISKKSVLDNILNKLNAKSNDGWYDTSGNWVTPGYRLMVKQWTPPETRKPVGAILNFFLQQTYGRGTAGYTNMGVMCARLGVTWNSRGQLSDEYRPNDVDYKTGKYLVCDKTKDGVYIPRGMYDEIEYRYWVSGGSAYTGGTEGSFAIGTNKDEAHWRNLTFENADGFWSLKLQSCWQRWGPVSAGLEERELPTVYGGTFSSDQMNMTVPIMGEISGSAICLLNEDYSKNILASAYDSFDGYECRILSIRNRNNDDIVVSSQNNYGTASDALIKIKYNYHPHVTKELEKLLDYTVYDVLNEKNYLFNGLPIFTATADGVVKFKINFYSAGNNNVCIGLQTEKFENDDSKYIIDSNLNLKDENGNAYTSNEFESGRDYTFVADVKKNETLYLKTYDATDNEEFSGAKITSDIELEANIQ